MNQTTNYQLSQWEEEDRILREDFNTDNAKVDAALAALAARDAAETQARGEAVNRLNGRFYISSFQGDGSSSGNRSISFPRRPLFIAFSGGLEALFYAASGSYAVTVPYNSGSVTATLCSLSGNTFSWKTNYCNRSGVTYQVFAILAA